MTTYDSKIVTGLRLKELLELVYSFVVTLANTKMNKDVTVAGTKKTTSDMKFVNGTNTTVAWDSTNNAIKFNATDTWRAVKVGGTQKIASNSNTALDFEGGGSVTVTFENNKVKITGAATDISGKQDHNISTANAVIVTDSNGNIIASTEVNTTKLGYLSDLTEKISTSLGNKQDNITFADSTGTAIIAAGTGLTLKPGDNVTFVKEQTSGNFIDINATDTTYSAATASTLGLARVAEISSVSGYTSAIIGILNAAEGSAILDNGKLYLKQATSSTGGVLTDAQATKLNGIESGATADSFNTNYFTETSNQWCIANNVSLPGSPTTTTPDSTDNSTKIATTEFVQSVIASKMTGAAMFKGTANNDDDKTSPTIKNLTNYKAGWYWVVGTAGTYAGKVCEIGDFIFCVDDYASAYSADDFSVVQNNVDIISSTEITTLYNDVFNPNS